MAGDIVLLATDGLFDNLDLDEIVNEVNQWESKWFGEGGHGVLQLPSSQGQNALDDLAKSIVHKARELSLDTKVPPPTQYLVVLSLI